MTQNHRILLALIAGFAFAGNVSAADVAKVNGIGIPQSRLDAIVQAAQHNQQQDTPELRAKIKENLIISEIISQEAVKKGLEKDPEVIAKLDLERQKALNGAYFEDYVKNNPVNDADAKKEYDNIKLANAGKSNYKVHHILVKTEAEAKSIISQIKKGTAKFEDLAKKKSIDPSSKTGGDLGWINLDQIVPEFGDAVLKLKKGQVTDAPVQTQFGYHVIRLDDSKPVEVPSYEELKPQIVRMIQQRNLDQTIKALRDKAKVE